VTRNHQKLEVCFSEIHLNYKVLISNPTLLQTKMAQKGKQVRVGELAMVLQTIQ
jgi:hypothetical protein